MVFDNGVEKTNWKGSSFAAYTLARQAEYILKVRNAILNGPINTVRLASSKA